MLFMCCVHYVYSRHRFFFINYKWVSFFCAFWWSPSKQNGIGLVACVACGSAHITKYLVSLTTQCHCDAGRFFYLFIYHRCHFFFPSKESQHDFCWTRAQFNVLAVTSSQFTSSILFFFVRKQIGNCIAAKLEPNTYR